MTNDLEIRALRAEDEADWRKLWTAYLEFYESSVPEDVYKSTFARLIDPARTNQCAAIALLDSKAIGLVHWIYHPHNWKIEDVIYLQDLYADPSARGTGVGRALIEHVYNVADHGDTPTVYWMTQEFNTTARLLYDRIASKTVFVQYKR
ncbi:MAG: GNAT family N-acetyltransferase [Planktotalea sp.]|uniref:GNAT family N-acetyltransferase n=1 Tax=Planktotalea sp. TaxID=2029877 RepID=UPI003C72B03E